MTFWEWCGEPGRTPRVRKWTFRSCTPEAATPLTLSIIAQGEGRRNGQDYHFLPYHVTSLDENMKHRKGSHLHDAMDGKCSIQQLSERSGVPEETIKSILYRGHTDMRVSTARRLAKALDCTMEDITEEEESG